MANMSHNKLIVIKKDDEKSQSEFNQFISDNLRDNEEAQKTDLTFEGLIPMPEELKITSPAQDENEKKQAEINLEKYGAKDWYDWACKNWGTKFDAITNGVKKTDSMITIDFDSAWAPPELWLDKIAATYLNLEFEFYCSEEQGSFDGKGIVKNGEWDWKINRPASWLETELNK